jgi:hypothetical protein
MLKIGQNLPLDSKTAQHFVGIRASLKYFDRYALFKLSVRAFGEVNGSHTAASKFAYNCVCTYSISNSMALLLPEPYCGQPGEFFENTGVLGQQPFSFMKECRVIRARFSEHCRPPFD